MFPELYQSACHLVYIIYIIKFYLLLLLLAQGVRKCCQFLCTQPCYFTYTMLIKSYIFVIHVHASIAEKNNIDALGSKRREHEMKQRNTVTKRRVQRCKGGEHTQSDHVSAYPRAQEPGKRL